MIKTRVKLRMSSFRLCIKKSLNYFWLCIRQSVFWDIKHKSLKEPKKVRCIHSYWDNGNSSQNFPSNSTAASSHKVQLMKVPQVTSMGTWNQMSVKSLLPQDSGNPSDTQHHPVLRLVRQWWTIKLFPGFSGTSSQKVRAGAPRLPN